MIVYHLCDKADGEQPDGDFIYSVRRAQKGSGKDGDHADKRIGAKKRRKTNSITFSLKIGANIVS